jgi:hypothetical protein
VALDVSGFDRRAEAEALLAEDDTRVGLIWRADRDGIAWQELVERGELSTKNGVSNTRALIRVLRDDEVPQAPSLAAMAARKVRAWLRDATKPLSADLRADLERQLHRLEAQTDSVEAQAVELATAAKATAEAESQNVPGLYVYTLPHYLRHPLDTETGRTLLKVGHSAVDAHYRAGSQGRLTALPEDPILLRIYPVEQSAHAEKVFHAWLRDADHTASRSKRGGSEWFLTSTKFLDRIALSTGLDVRAVGDYEAGND